MIFLVGDDKPREHPFGATGLQACYDVQYPHTYSPYWLMVWRCGRMDVSEWTALINSKAKTQGGIKLEFCNVSREMKKK